MPATDGRFDALVGNFGQAVVRLEGVVGQFESALGTFAGNTRDFREFNTHLKDNIQRMSLQFGDLSEVLKTEAGNLRGRDPRPR